MPRSASASLKSSASARFAASPSSAQVDAPGGGGWRLVRGLDDEAASSSFLAVLLAVEPGLLLAASWRSVISGAAVSGSASCGASGGEVASEADWASARASRLISPTCKIAAKTFQMAPLASGASSAPPSFARAPEVSARPAKSSRPLVLTFASRSQRAIFQSPLLPSNTHSAALPGLATASAEGARTPKPPHAPPPAAEAAAEAVAESAPGLDGLGVAWTRSWKKA
mmetsp:Transcript_66701/g.150660  ORF Transcript_66701/g.150660 Transcript_66701/m.150660 type:complete len:227 (-) Transcript_66701:109-789(-)